MKNNNLSSNWIPSGCGLPPPLLFPFIPLADSGGSPPSLHQCPRRVIRARLPVPLSVFPWLTNANTLRPPSDRRKAPLDKPFRQIPRRWLESFNSNKGGRAACLLLVIPHLLDKDSQGSSAALNWCTYPYLYWSSLWIGGGGLGGGGLTGLAAIQALMPICLSSFMAELATS